MFSSFVTFLGSCANGTKYRQNKQINCILTRSSFFATGYDGSLFSGISPMTQYRDHFKVSMTRANRFAFPSHNLTGHISCLLHRSKRQEKTFPRFSPCMV